NGSRLFNLTLNQCRCVLMSRRRSGGRWNNQLVAVPIAELSTVIATACIYFSLVGALIAEIQINPALLREHTAMNAVKLCFMVLGRYEFRHSLIEGPMLELSGGEAALNELLCSARSSPTNGQTPSWFCR